MAKTKNTNVGMSASLKPKRIKESKKSKVYGFTFPKLGRFAFSRDNGEADLFFRTMVTTNLRAIHRAGDRSIRGAMQKGEILGEYDLGSGFVTNVGVTALANDSNWFANTTENLATFNTLKYMMWGTGTVESTAGYWRLETQAEAEGGTKKEAIATTASELKYLAAGNSKIIIKSILENVTGKTPAITEWGLFSAAKTEGTGEVAATGATVTSLSDSAVFKVAPGSTESKNNARGAQQYIIWAKEKESAVEEQGYGLIQKNTTSEVTIPGWVKGGTNGKGTAEEYAGESANHHPYIKSKYNFFPVMFDRRKFAAINLELNNKIEFPYELTINSGG